MTKDNARELIMRETQRLMKAWDEMHQNDGMKRDMNARLAFINENLASNILEEVRKTAV